MTTFLYAMLGMLTIDIIGRLTWLATGTYPIRTPVVTAWDLAINVGFAGWAIYLLASRP